MQADILAVQKELQQANKGLDEQRAQLQEQLQRADAKIAEVARTLDDLNRAARLTDADFGVQIERMVREVQELRGAVELANYRLGRLEQHLEGDGSLVDRVAAMERSAAGGPPPTATMTTEPPKDKKDLLAYAAQLAKKGEGEEAKGVYRDIIKRWPKEFGVSDQAYFRLGELYYQGRRTRSAMQEFAKIVEDFAKGSYADDALFRLGVCSMDLGSLEDAKIFFDEILHSHKRSPLRKTASDKLKDVNKRLAEEQRKRKKKKKKKSKK